MTGALPETLPADPDARLALLGAVLANRVEAAIPAFVTASVVRILDVWGRLDPDARVEAEAAAAAIGPDIARSVGDELRAELERSAAEQRRTPLEITARVVAAPTAILADLGIPEVVRDDLDVERHPADRYNLTPRMLSDLGDPELGPVQLAWGLAKHEALRKNR